MLNGWASAMDNKRTDGGRFLPSLIGSLPARVRRFGSSLALTAPAMERSARNAYSYSLLGDAEKGGYIH